MNHTPQDDRFPVLVERYYAVVYRFAYRLTGSVVDAEDLTQQAFLTAQRKLGQLRDPKRSCGWLYAIVRNTYLKQCRGARGIGKASLDEVPEPMAAGPVNTEIDAEVLQNALNEMPEAYRTPLILYYFDEFSYKEIAEQLDVPIGTIMSRLSRAKRALRSRLEKDQPAVAQSVGNTSLDDG